MSEEIRTEYDLREEFISFASSRDVSIYDPILDGTLRRCKGKSKNSAWYIGSYFTTRKGLLYLSVIFGDWVSNERYVFTPDIKITLKDKEDIAFKQKQAKKAADEARKKLNAEAVETAKSILNTGLKATADHPYLQRKKVEPHDLLMDGNKLFVPFRTLRGSLTGGQHISPQGGKYQILGTALSGSVYTFGNLKNPSKIVYLCEGWATGATIRQATSSVVVVAFTAGNLLNVAQELKKTYPQINVVIAGDDDHVTDGNPGRTKAVEAAKIFMNKPVIPVFMEYDGKATTDFNDLHVREGLSEVKDQLCLESGERITYRPLGQNGPYHYFYSYKNNSILRFRSFTNDTILKLIPFEIEELETMFPKAEGGVYWDQARAQIITESMEAGMFNPHRVRGVGVWKEGSATIVNTGSKLLVNGCLKDMSDIQSKYTYTASQFEFDKPPDPLTPGECRALVLAVKHFNWESVDSIPLILGWIAIARIAGALPIRPRLWITAGEGCGKSVLFERVITPSLGGDEGFLPAGQDSTAAGIRQTLQGDSLPVIYDEFETEANNHIQQSLIEMMRQSWSQSNARMYKGTTGGTALNYDPQFTALVCSIKVHLKSAQDKGRFSVLELARHKSDPVHEANLFKACEMISPEFGKRLFARSIAQIDNIIEGYKVFKRVIIQMGHASRLADQMGMLLAGYFSLTSDELPTEEGARQLCMMLTCLTDKEQSRSERDEELCLNHLLTTKVRYTRLEGDQVTHLEDSIVNILQGPCRSELEKYGLKFHKTRKDGKEYLAVANSHVELARIFEKSHWKNWNHSLSRLNGALKSVPVRMSGVVNKGVCIPFDVILGTENEDVPKVWSLCNDVRYEKEIYLAGTQIEIVNDLFYRHDLDRDVKVGIGKQLKKNPSLKVIKLNGKYRTIEADSIKLIPKSS